MSEYTEKLKDPRWQRMRLVILERDSWTCRFCMSTTRTLHVHHLLYIKGRDPWDYPPGALMTFCEECHEQEHVYGRQNERELLDRLRLLGAASGELGELIVALGCPLNLANETLVRQITTREWYAIGTVLAALLRHVHSGGDLEAVARSIVALAPDMPEVTLRP